MDTMRDRFISTTSRLLDEDPRLRSSSPRSAATASVRRKRGIRTG